MAIGFVVVQHLFKDGPAFLLFGGTGVIRSKSIFTASSFASYEDAQSAIETIEERKGIFQIEKTFFNK